MFLIPVVIVCFLFFLAYSKSEVAWLDKEVFRAYLKKWLIRCLIFAGIMLLVEVLFWTPLITHNRSQGGVDYSLDLRGGVFFIFGVLFNFIFFACAGGMYLLKVRKK